MNINPMNFIYNLKYMGVGMLGILIVIGVIILVTMILNKVTAKKD
ncbi:MAG: oxaloacetate decarboxylase [Clostridia bacterium]|nr:oxaloacetate decarboxylase [Clostridia bacterium]